MKYLHLRYRDKEGLPLKKGGVTVAYRIEPTKDGIPIAACAIARCSFSDHYDKARGREIAQGRWLRAFDTWEGNDHCLLVPLVKGKNTLVRTLQKLVLPCGI